MPSSLCLPGLPSTDLWLLAFQTPHGSAVGRQAGRGQDKKAGRSGGGNASKAKKTAAAEQGVGESSAESGSHTDRDDEQEEAEEGGGVGGSLVAHADSGAGMEAVGQRRDAGKRGRGSGKEEEQAGARKQQMAGSVPGDVKSRKKGR